jgi:hypothetical protein
MKFSVLVMGWLIYALLFSQVAAEENLREAMTQGKTAVDLRYRFELVDQEGLDKTANASTLRLRLGYTTQSFWGFNLHLDLDSLHVIGPEDYNSTDNGKVRYPVVADPADQIGKLQFRRFWFGYCEILGGLAVQFLNFERSHAIS